MRIKPRSAVEALREFLSAITPEELARIEDAERIEVACRKMKNPKKKALLRKAYMEQTAIITEWAHSNGHIGHHMESENTQEVVENDE